LGLSSFSGYGLALVALALVVFGAIECPPSYQFIENTQMDIHVFMLYPRTMDVHPSIFK